jgi:hypothetical protein
LPGNRENDTPIATRAVVLTAVAGAVYLLVAGGYRFQYRQTPFVHHILIADAMLHGQLHVRDEVARRMVRTLHDWTVVDGKLYGYWAPLAPVVMMPFVAAFGPTVSDRVVDACFGALNVGLFYWFLRRAQRTGLLPLSEYCCVALALLLGFGSVGFYLSCTGRVWFAVQVFTLTAVLAACVAILTPSASIFSHVVAGCFFGAAILGRNITAGLALFFVVVIWLRSAGAPRRRAAFAVRLASFAMPCVVAIGLQALYNYERFGDVREDGAGLQITTTGDPRFAAEYVQHGLFSPYYLGRNAKYYLWNYALPADVSGERRPDLNGNSMFLVTPPLVYVALAWRRRAPLALAAAVGVAPFVAALMFYLATGYTQFGNRYLLEGLPLLLVLVGAGMKGEVGHGAYVLVVLAVAMNAWGTYVWSCMDDCSALAPYVGRWTLPAFVAAALAARVVWAWRRRPAARGVRSSQRDFESPSGPHPET